MEYFNDFDKTDLSLWHKMARLSEYAYHPFEKENMEKQALSERLTALGYMLEKTFSVAAPKEDKELDLKHSYGTQGFICSNRKIRVLVFRGTELDGWDIVSDLRFSLRPIKDGGFGHSGFFDAYGTVENEIKTHLECKNDDIPLVVTGHSLGGALATVAASCLKNVESLVTFGAPAISTSPTVPTSIRAFRFVNSADIVPRCMMLGGLPLGFIWLLCWIYKWLLSLFKKESPKTEKFMGLIADSMGTLGKYAHQFPGIGLGDNGVLLDYKKKEGSLKVFWEIFISNRKRMFLDHSISEYVKKIKPDHLNLIL